MKRITSFILLVTALYSCQDEEAEPTYEYWNQLTTHPEGWFWNPVTFSLNSKLYIGTGNNQGHVQNTFLTYDLSSNSWEEAERMPTGVRDKAIAFVIDDKAYVGLGSTCTNTESGTCEFLYYRDLWSFDEINGWIQMDSIPEMIGTDLKASFTINKSGYVIVSGERVERRNVLWEFDSERHIWIEKGIYPGNCYPNIAFSINGKAYVGLGWGSGACNEFWEYNPLADQWEQLANFNGKPRLESFAISINEYGYVFGGRFHGGTIFDDDEHLFDVWRFDANSKIWMQIEEDYPGEGNLNLIGELVDGKLIFGMGDYSDDLWEFKYNSIE
ncbi:MAG: kelch repeat-containing protein [Marinoscillum sp.]